MMTTEGSGPKVGDEGADLPHISVCVCTFKRPGMLASLLQELEDQETGALFTYSIVVADNHAERSALAVVERFSAGSRLAVKYCVEPRQNIARARNASVRAADGEFVAFIDDDECPARDWLLRLFTACIGGEAAGVLGPVVPRFGASAPRWLTEGGFYDRPRLATGTPLDWPQTRTGNTLLRASVFDGDEPFDPACLSGSDIEFFKRMTARGHSFTWCDEAVVFETIPPARCTRSFLVRRSLFRGMFSARNHGFPLKLIGASLVAAPAYAALLPVGLLLGQVSFSRCLFKLSYHLGRLVALTGVNPIRKPYVCE